MEVTALHSVAGVLPPASGLLRRPPFQAPHHTASAAALVGGGSGLARPGALSLAHRGILFLDEAPEFSARALEALRQPLEEGVVRLRRARGETDFPAQVQLVLAANPCPCARPAGDLACQCSPLVRRRYLRRLSGPLLDRVDMRVDLAPARRRICSTTTKPRRTRPGGAAGGDGAGGGGGAVVGARWRSTPRSRGRCCAASGGCRRGARRALAGRSTRGLISARGFDRVSRVAWTVVTWMGVRAPPPRMSTKRATCGWVTPGGTCEGGVTTDGIRSPGWR